MDERTGSRRAGIALVVLTLATLVLRLWGIGYGVPVWEEPDPDIVGHVDLIQSGATLAGVEHPEQQYPHLVADLARWMPGRRPQCASPFLQDHLAAAAHTHVMVRLVVALLAILLVPLTFSLARRFTSPGWSLFAAALVATSLLHQSFAQQARPHAAAASLFALAVLADLRLVREGGVRSYLAAGIALALALGTLHSAVSLFIPGLVAHALRSGGIKRFFNAKLAIPIALAALAVPLFYPFLFGLGLLGEPDKLDVEGSGVRFAEHALSFAQFNGRGFVVLAQVLWSYEPLLVVALPIALLGWLVGRARNLDRTARAERTVALSFALPYLAAIGLFELTYERFALPLLPFFAVFVAVGLQAWCARAASPALRRAIAALAITALALPAAACAKLGWLRSRPDTLDEATAWLVNRPERERVFVSASQPLDLPLMRAVQGLKPFGEHQLTPWTRWQAALPNGCFVGEHFDLRWLVGPPRDVALGEHLASLAPALFVIEAYEHRLGHPALSELCSELAKRGQRLARFSPDRDAEASELELFFQLSDHFNEAGEDIDWPNFTWRLLGARAIGPVIEIWRVEGR